ncbi:MAG: phenylacetate--CoA ligase family protein [Segetibacter sp.]|nr:phenylacetate--CoA ligase family protein [Segetibacter sp.]
MGFLHDRIYKNLPVPLQNLAISAFGVMWHNRRFGGVFKKAYPAFKAREGYTAEQWKEYQTKQFQKILLHAFQTVPYYRSALTQAGFSESTINNFTLDQLDSIPVLEKETLRRFGNSTLLSDKRERGGSFYSSSGSTGTPTNILYSFPMHQRLSALYEARVRNWASVSRHDARCMIGGRRIVAEGECNPPYYRYNIIEKQLYCSAYHISAGTAAGYLQGIKDHNVKYMVGYAMSNYILARFIKQAGLKAPKMKAVLTSSEKLTPEMRRLISEVYDCKVYDAWSGVEWCGLISENEHGQLLISPDAGYVEILKPDGTPAGPGEEGELVCTGFLNYDQPLIRYKIGDIVRLSEDQRALCGRNFTVVDEIIGRSEDVVVGRDGREMVRFHGIFIGLDNVIKAQVVQEDYEHFTINVLTYGLTSSEKNLIRQRMISQLGSISLTINEVTDIPSGPNGKFKAVISKIEREVVNEA